MTLHYVPMGKSKTGPNQRVYHSQNDAVGGNFGYDRDKESEKEKLKRSLHGENAHVPDCLVWDIDDKSNRKYEAGYGSPRHQRKDYMSKRTPRGNEFSITNYKPLPRHPELGRARNHLYGEDGPPNLQWKVKPNDGGVAEAMVGWPETKREEEEERYGRYGTEWEVNLGARNGYPLDSSRKDCKTRCDKRAGVCMDMDKRNRGPSDCQCSDHRTCGCVPERQQQASDYEQRPYQPHSRDQYTYKDEGAPKDGSTFFIV